ncbi:hypothetical protein L2K70_17345 [Nocardioides KLBMP 9356]|uniref:Uncharacterized protein n=1 Tax=Nocardioides potassii TaxID=2911371 RepID=A0ABS9HG07_9ACTN|nr:hypothetical protein [Nocardioides potassii]MCF6379379.1 hypothetical protein [Nocardioides potassii]
MQNNLTQLGDSRWLILNGGKALVSSAVMQVQSQLTGKDAKGPDKTCKELGGFPEPSDLEFTATIKKGRVNEVRLSANATGAPLVGYAQKITNPIDSAYPYSPIGSPKSNSPDFTGTWLAGSDVGLLRDGTGTMQLVASACLSAAFPTGAPAVYQARFRNGTLVALKALAALPSDADVLANTACYGNPS